MIGWKAQFDGETCWHITGERGVYIGWTEDGEDTANLLAAAPLMYEALKAIKLDWHTPLKIWKLRNEALAKAKGN